MKLQFEEEFLESVSYYSCLHGYRCLFKHCCPVHLDDKILFILETKYKP
jgi:hypothetical protein